MAKLLDLGRSLIAMNILLLKQLHKGKRDFVYPIDPNMIERKWRYARQSVDEVKHLLRAKKNKNRL